MTSLFSLKQVLPIALLLVAFSSKGQQHQVEVSSGVITTTSIIVGVSDAIQTAAVELINDANGNTASLRFEGDRVLNPTYGISYENRFHKHWSFIGDYTYQPITRSVYYDGTFRGTVSSRAHTFGIGIKGRYWVSEWTEGYSALRIAGTNQVDEYDIEDESQTLSWGYTNTQITLFGLRVGKQLGANLELGFGYGGVVKYGLDYRF